MAVLVQGMVAVRGLLPEGQTMKHYVGQWLISPNGPTMRLGGQDAFGTKEMEALLTKHLGDAALEGRKICVRATRVLRYLRPQGFEHEEGDPSRKLLAQILPGYILEAVAVDRRWKPVVNRPQVASNLA